MDQILQQYVGPTITWIMGLLTPAEWSALVWLVPGTLVFTHFAKLVWRLSPIPGGGNANVIHLIAGVIGFLIAIPVWPETGHAPWWIAGPVAGGGGAILIFKMFYPLLQYFFPKIAAAVNAERRQADSGPPAGVPGRRSEDGIQKP